MCLCWNSRQYTHPKRADLYKTVRKASWKQMHVVKGFYLFSPPLCFVPSNSFTHFQSFVLDCETELFLLLHTVQKACLIFDMHPPSQSLQSGLGLCGKQVSIRNLKWFISQSSALSQSWLIQSPLGPHQVWSLSSWLFHLVPDRRRVEKRLFT